MPADSSLCSWGPAEVLGEGLLPRFPAVDCGFLTSCLLCEWKGGCGHWLAVVWGLEGEAPWAHMASIAHITRASSSCPARGWIAVYGTRSWLARNCRNEGGRGDSSW